MSRVRRAAPRLKHYGLLRTEDERGLQTTMVDFLEALELKHFTEATVETRATSLCFFLRWCVERSLRRPEELTRPILERYQRHLYLHRKKNGRPLGVGTQRMRLVAVRLYFRWLTRKGLLLSNPAADIDVPRETFRLPRAVLTPLEVEAVLKQPQLSTPNGLRDRALMEVLYATGMRRKEVAGLKVSDVDAERGTVWVREGKGRKDRLLPIGERALEWVEKYVEEARAKLTVGEDERWLFVSETGGPFDLEYLTHLVKRYVDAAQLGKQGSCHLLRHSMATAMLEAGADIRFIQVMLGHADLSSTQLYTHVAIAKLMEVHAATHPAAKLQHKPEQLPAAEVSAAALLDALEVEAQEETLD